VERRIQSIGLTFHHSLRCRGFQLFVRHHDDDTPVIQPTTSSTSRHLNVLSSRQVAEIFAVEFSNRSEHDRFRGHVESDREGFGREQDFDESFLEQDLDHLFQDGQESSVMDSDPAFE
jgi:hypothetical protein